MATNRSTRVSEPKARGEPEASAPVFRARLSQAATRGHVLGKVYELIAEHGIEGLNMRQVAEATGLSTGTINHHFGNKRGLLIAALENAYELPPDWEQYRGSPASQLRRLVTGYVCRPGEDRFWRFWVNYLAMGTRDDEMRSHQKVRFERQERFWAQLIRDGIATGEFRKCWDEHEKARELLVLAHGLLVQQLVVATPASREQARKTLSAFLSDLAA